VGRRILIVALAAGLVVAVPAAAAEKKKRPPKPVKVQVLGINDFHGHLDAATTGRVRRGLLKRSRVPAGGAEYLATHVRMLRRRNPNTLLVSAGDLVGASPLLSALFHDEPTIEAMNAIGLDINAVGNHEFDEGAAELVRLQRGGCHPHDGCGDGTGFGGARFRFLAANVRRRSTGRPIFPPYAIRKVAGVRIGFIGMTLEGTPGLVPPSVADELRFADEADTANRYVRRLRRRKVQAIVVLLHEGGYQTRRETIDGCPGLSGPLADIIRRTSPEVDVFLTGHTHAAYNCVIDRRRVTSAGSFGRLITRVELEIDRRHNDVVRARADNWIVGQDVTREPGITALIARYSAFADPLRARVIGRLAQSAGRSRDDSGESRMGNLVADSQRRAVGAAAAFVDMAVLRTGLSAGDVTYGRAFMALPFGTSLVTMTLTGAQLHELLKQQWCGRPSPEILQPSGTVTYAWSAAGAAAITGVPCATAPSPISELRIDGRLVEPQRRYRVTVNSLLAGGRHGFGALAGGSDRVGGPTDTAALESHLTPSLAGEPVAPPPTDRIVRAP
jgi:5'-nucleotidase